MRQWRLMLDGPAGGARNMALDEALLLHIGAQPVLRFYSWAPYCLSLGYGQRCRVVDEERLRARGFTLVRRPSGGGAILHAQELTWCLALPVGHPLLAGSLVAGYRRISALLHAALSALKVPVAVRQDAPRRPCDAACFATPAQYELVVAGRKLLGGARVQRRCGHLYHGSLPLAGDVAAICDLLRYPDEAARARAANRLRGRALTLAQASGGRPAGRAQLTAAIVDAFRAAHGVCFREDALTGPELARAAALEHDRYGNPAWVCRR